MATDVDQFAGWWSWWCSRRLGVSSRQHEERQQHLNCASQSHNELNALLL